MESPSEDPGKVTYVHQTAVPTSAVNIGFAVGVFDTYSVDQATATKVHYCFS